MVSHDTNGGEAVRETRGCSGDTGAVALILLLLFEYDNRLQDAPGLQAAFKTLGRSVTAK